MNHYDDHGVGDLKAEIKHLNLVIERLTEQKKFHKERNDEWIKQANYYKNKWVTLKRLVFEFNTQAREKECL